ncbi:Antiseptic resistance protein [Streptomyces sp. RB5]|uniref:Antiseptic resistance protein n=1 Tax=Streptomyces smaragdinus TaxID=2585196 RepID=A0A7K0CJG1_9ACTN|nr:MFS transporter [Streptomyces smaragdinus]MQY13172.1 Antiseptic resistance protein [Streptomyces smaragdinus]
MAGTTTAAVQPGRVSAGRHARRVGRRGGAGRWTVLIVLCSSLLLVALDATVLHVAVPSLTEDLRPSSTDLLWIVDAYPLVAASLLILFGTLGDRVGRRRVLLLGYALFGVASALAASAHNPGVLIAARALLGVGGAMIMPATLSILRHVFPDRRERALAIGIWSATAAVGAAIGPLLGGFLVEHYWWGSVFLVNIPLMIVAVPVGRWLLPESVEGRSGPWDVLGALMAASGLFGLVYAVQQTGAGGGPLRVSVFGPALAGILLLALFVRRQRRRTHPLVDIRVIRRRAFGTAVGCIVLAMLALVGLQLIAVQYLQLVLGFTPLQAGVRLIPLTFAAIAAGLLGARMLARFGPRLMVALGFVLTAVAVLGLVAMGQHDQPVILNAGFVLLGFGLETTLFGSYESMLSEAPVEQAGGAAAIGETSYQLGAGIGIALLGSVMNAFYRPGVTDVPGVPAGAARAAGNSLGEAYEVAHELGGPRGAALRTAAREAFVHGMHVTLVVSAGLLLLGALAALRLPRAMECGPRHEAADDRAGRLDAGDFRAVTPAPVPAQRARGPVPGPRA